MISFRNVNQSDLNILVEWNNYDKIIKTLGCQFIYNNLEDDLLLYGNQISNCNNGIRCFVLDESGKEIGLISLTQIDFSTKEAKLNFYFNVLNTLDVLRDAILSMLSKAFYEMNLNFIHFNATKENNEIIHLIESIGFKIHICNYYYMSDDFKTKYDAIDNRNIPNHCVKLVRTPNEIKNILHYCDCAFNPSVCESENFPNVLSKIITYSDFVIAHNSDVLGFSAMYANDIVNSIAYITLIAVHPNYQRNNVGKSLIDECVHIAKNKNMKFIKLEVLKNNLSAINFYTKNGFVKTGEEKENSFYMIKDLRGDFNVD